MDIDLISNTVSVNKLYFIGITTSFGNVNDKNFNVSLGYIKMPESKYKEFNSTHNKGKIPVIGSVDSKQYDLYTHIADNSLKMVKEQLYNAWYTQYKNTKYNGKIITFKSIDLKWQDKIKLNIEDSKYYDVYNYSQIFIDNKYLI